MNFLLWGITLGTIGKLTLGLAVLRVHLRIFEEHAIDGAVLNAIRREHVLTLLSIALIVGGYILEILFYADSTNFFQCHGTECGAIINAAFLLN